MDEAVNAAVVLNYLNNNAAPRLRGRENAFDLEDRIFKKIFRISKDQAGEFIDILTPYLTEPSRISAIDIDTKVLIALRFLASGSYQLNIAFNRYFNVSQPTISRCVNEVVTAANRPEIMDAWIRFPNSLQELVHLRDSFLAKYAIPALGCIDCTHVAIFPPRIEDEIHPEHVYVNRKGYHSINVQLICDYNLNILNVNAKYPGSVHDSHIWEMSNVNESLKQIYRRWPNEYFHLLGKKVLQPLCSCMCCKK